MCLSNVVCRRLGDEYSLIALSPKLQEGSCFSVETRNIAVNDGFPNDADGGFGTEEVFVIEFVDHFHDVLGGQPRILDMGNLMPSFVGHGSFGHESIFLNEFEEFRPWEGVSHRDLDGFAIKMFGKLDGVADGFLRLAWETKDEVAVDYQAELVAGAGEVQRTLDGCALLDVLEDLRISPGPAIPASPPTMTR
jgi:hypothetical protein